jgi:hypothetical protein
MSKKRTVGIMLLVIIGIFGGLFALGSLVGNRSGTDVGSSNNKSSITSQPQPTTPQPQPAATPVTTVVSQSNSTSSAIQEGPTIRKLVFRNGTGWLTLESDPHRVIPFNHTLTIANGYTYDNYSAAPFFANNGTKVDLNSINFSSQVTIDPKENVTLTAHPKISPSVGQNVLSLPPPSPSPSPAAPPTATQQPPPSSAEAIM